MGEYVLGQFPAQAGLVALPAYRRQVLLKNLSRNVRIFLVYSTFNIESSLFSIAGASSLLLGLKCNRIIRVKRTK
jgi:hypothetical protein